MHIVGFSLAAKSLDRKTLEIWGDIDERSGLNAIKTYGQASDERALIGPISEQQTHLIGRHFLCHPTAPSQRTS